MAANPSTDGDGHPDTPGDQVDADRRGQLGDELARITEEETGQRTAARLDEDRCECPGCHVLLFPGERWFCDLCQYDVGPGCGCGFIPEWNR